MRKKRTPNTECSVCGKPLYRRPFEFREGKEFCCKGCRSELYKRKPEIWKANLEKGRGWNKGMSLEAGDILLYGRPRSEETKKNISRRLQEVLIKTGEIRVCPICGTERYAFPSTIKKGYGIFCSKRCATINRNLNQKTEDTDIEIILENWLIEKGIEYTKQTPIEAMTIPDFFIQPNICLYADGDYWHSLKITKTRDARIDIKLKERGFNVIRLLGSEIKAGVRPVELLCEA